MEKAALPGRPSDQIQYRNASDYSFETDLSARSIAWIGRRFGIRPSIAGVIASAAGLGMVSR